MRTALRIRAARDHTLPFDFHPDFVAMCTLVAIVLAASLGLAVAFPSSIDLIYENSDQLMRLTLTGSNATGCTVDGIRACVATIGLDTVSQIAIDADWSALRLKIV
jgi:hypothetical protein